MLSKICLVAFVAFAGAEDTLQDVHDGFHDLSDMIMDAHGNGAAYVGASSMFEKTLMGAQAMVDDAKSNLAGIIAANDALKVKLSSMQKKVDDANHEDVVNNLQKQTDTEISKTKAAVDATTQFVENTIANGIADITDTNNKAIAAWKKANVDSALDSKMPVRRHLFAGRSRTWGDRGGWKDFIVNQVQCNTAAPMFQLRTSTRFRALKVGVYHIMWWAIQHGGRCHAHSRIRYDGGAWLYNHNHNWLTDGAWEGNQLDLYWKFNANKDFWTTHSNGCGHRWHISPGDVNDGNSYNRIFVEYVGQVLDDKGNQVRWNGPQ